jgi:hypothetical protein
MKLFKHKLAKEISLALLAKFLLLTLIWWICFSHPVSEKTSLQNLSHLFQSQSGQNYARQS